MPIGNYYKSSRRDTFCKCFVYSAFPVCYTYARNTLPFVTAWTVTVALRQPLYFSQPVWLTIACGQSGRGSDSPPGCHSLPRLRFAYPRQGEPLEVSASPIFIKSCSMPRLRSLYGDALNIRGIIRCSQLRLCILATAVAIPSSGMKKEIGSIHDDGQQSKLLYALPNCDGTPISKRSIRDNGRLSSKKIQLRYSVEKEIFI